VTLSTITVTPVNVSIPTFVNGFFNTQQFKATGNYNNGTTQDLTTQVSWGSSDTNIATISAQGLATATCSGGQTTISAVTFVFVGRFLREVTDSTTLTFTNGGCIG
jgi:hypothetical protein